MTLYLRLVLILGRLVLSLSHANGSCEWIQGDKAWRFFQRGEVMKLGFISGLLFGSGLIIAAVLFKVLLHVSICG